MKTARGRVPRSVFIDLPHHALISQTARRRRPEHRPPASPGERPDRPRTAGSTSTWPRPAGSASWAEAWDALFEMPRPADIDESLRRDMAIFCRRCSRDHPAAAPGAGRHIGA